MACCMYFLTRDTTKCSSERMGKSCREGSKLTVDIFYSALYMLRIPVIGISEISAKIYE